MKDGCPELTARALAHLAHLLPARQDVQTLLGDCVVKGWLTLMPNHIASAFIHQAACFRSHATEGEGRQVGR